MRHHLPFGTLALIFAAAGCSGAPLRTEAVKEDIRAAEVEGAQKVPTAALHLTLAKESLASATQLYAAGDRVRARSLLTRAEADAELATVLSREDAQKQEAVYAVDRVWQLRQDYPERRIP